MLVLLQIQSVKELYHSPPQPVGCVTGIPIAIGTAFGSFKKYASHFLNPDCIGTESKKAPNPVTGESGRLLE